VGLIAGVELMADRQRRVPFDPALKIGQRVADACQQHGLIVRAIGDRIAFTPPLIITEAEIDDMCGRFGRGLDAVAASINGSAG
ncbi:MAG: aspartate aminotransferase family protein, partial [Rhodopila sp.]|nr:aspartate aminotransferase family protein [Rhodopila sp.]